MENNSYSDEIIVNKNSKFSTKKKILIIFFSILTLVILLLISHILIQNYSQELWGECYNLSQTDNYKSLRLDNCNQKFNLLDSIDNVLEAILYVLIVLGPFILVSLMVWLGVSLFWAHKKDSGLPTPSIKRFMIYSIIFLMVVAGVIFWIIVSGGIKQ